MYTVYHLRTQAADVLRTEFDGERREITPDTISMVYSGVPSGSVLRQLCSSAFALTRQRHYPKAATRVHTDYLDWKSAFKKFADLGCDYFMELQTLQNAGQIGNIMSGGKCRFHDHSDIFAWARADTDTCPYPHGTPLKTHLFKPYVEESPAEEPITEEWPAEEPVAEEPAAEEPAAEELPIDELPAEPEYPSAGPEAAVEEAVPEPAPEPTLYELGFQSFGSYKKGKKRIITCRWGRLKGMRRYPQQRAPIHNRSRLKIPMVFLPPSRNLRKMSRA
jgi:hypothetical protein